jgi:hypothetical protein
MRSSSGDDSDDQGKKQVPKLMHEIEIETLMAQDGELYTDHGVYGELEILLDKLECDEDYDVDALHSIILVTTASGDDKMIKTLVTQFQASSRWLLLLQMVNGAILLEDRLHFPGAGDGLKSRCHAAEVFEISPAVGTFIVQTLFNIAHKQGQKPVAAASIHVTNGSIICLHYDIS